MSEQGSGLTARAKGWIKEVGDEKREAVARVEPVKML